MNSSLSFEAHRAWLARLHEAVLEPDLPIVDAHHHLWKGYGKPVPWQPDYWIDEFAHDLSSGHNVIASVFVECGFGYRTEGAAALKPVGEVETLDRFAEEFKTKHGTGTKPCAGIVGFADLRLGHAIEETLEAQVRASPRRFRGIRQIVNWDPSAEVRYPGVDIPAAAHARCEISGRLLEARGIRAVIRCVAVPSAAARSARAGGQISLHDPRDRSLRGTGRDRAVRGPASPRSSRNGRRT